jgi:hypothetical protein
MRRLRLAPRRASPSLALHHPSVWISQLGLHTTQCQLHGRRYPSVSGTATEKLLVMARDPVVRSGPVFRHSVKTEDQTKRSGPVLGRCGDRTAQRPRPRSGLGL